jgi:uncharacterized protein (TIGR02996 family)
MSEPGVLRTFVRRKGKRQEFWTIRPPWYRDLITSSGTTGPGDVERFDGASPDETQRTHDRLVAEKLAEGYVETTDDPWHGGFVSALRTSLEDALTDDPDDLATHMAYADHLTELGDPRGEFVQVQLALEDATLKAPQRKKLQKREADLLKAHERTWLGPMAGFWIDKLDWHEDDHGTGESPHQLTWRRGWVSSLWLHDGGAAACQAAVTRQPLLRYLRDFRILYAHRDNDSGPYDLARADCFRHVRHFQAGEEVEQSYFSGAIDIEGFLKQMPRLEEFHSWTGSDAGWLFAQRFAPGLRKLTVNHARGAYPFDVLLKNKALANLTHLFCWPRSQSNDRPDRLNEEGGVAYITRGGAAALFRSKKLPDLAHLQLRNSDIGDEGLRVLIASGRLRTLKTLDLLGGCVTDAGARLLAACPDVRNLEAINLSQNLLSEAGIAALRATGVNLTATAQHSPDALVSGEYLWSGDCE